MVYVVYDDVRPSGPTPYGYHDVFLASHAVGSPAGAWARQRVTQDPHNCLKLQVALVARAGRLDLAYIAFRGASSASGAEPPYALPHVLTGTPGHWREAATTHCVSVG